MKIEGDIRKMKTTLVNGVANYVLTLDNTDIPMNELLGKQISFQYTGAIFCVKCGAKTKTSFFQGFCYPCFTTAPEAEECVLRPELCQAQNGIARDMAFAQTHCLIPHYVYAADTGSIKVGVTRNTQIPTRWIDQGAMGAIICAQTPNRFIAGQIEVMLKQYFSDKTNWRKMLMQQKLDKVLLQQTYESVLKHLDPDYHSYAVHDSEIHHITYPGEVCDGKIQTINFDKTPFFSGTLRGIKGQYLLFDSNTVLNIRKYGGYRVQCTV